MRKILCLFVISVIFLSGCKEDSFYKPEQTLDVYNTEGIQICHLSGEDVYEFSDMMQEDSWEMLDDENDDLVDFNQYNEKYRLVFREKIDEDDYKKDVMVEFITYEGQPYIKEITHTGILDITYYKIPVEDMLFLNDSNNYK